MKQKVVGVMPLWDDDKASIWMLPGYLEGLMDAGATPFIFPLTDDRNIIETLVEKCDGLLLTGGHDVDPTLYGEEPLDHSILSCPVRDRLELMVIHEALEKDIPLLGICRGIQILNVSLGGTLYQDLPTQHQSAIDHHMHAPYDRICHDVKLCPNTPLNQLLAKETLGVNSYHHQAIKELAKPLRQMAVSEDGLIEAVYKPDQRFVWAVQWHPELCYKTDEDNRLIFKAFVNSL